MSTICIFGDSIAWGAFDPEGGGWAGRLRSFVDKTSQEELEIYNLGICGETTEDLILRFKSECEARQPDTIIFAIGINDSQIIDGKSQVTPERFEQNLNEILEQASSFTKDILFVGLSPVCESAEKFYTNEEIHKYDLALKRVAKDCGYKYIKIFEFLNAHDICDDGLHPNSLGHHKIFEIVKNEIFEN